MVIKKNLTANDDVWFKRLQQRSKPLIPTFDCSHERVQVVFWQILFPAPQLPLRRLTVVVIGHVIGRKIQFSLLVFISNFTDFVEEAFSFSAGSLRASNRASRLLILLSSPPCFPSN